MTEEKKATTLELVAAFTQELKLVEQGTIVLSGWYGIIPSHDYKDEIIKHWNECHALISQMKESGTAGQQAAEQCQQKLQAVTGLGEQWRQIVNGNGIAL